MTDLDIYCNYGNCRTRLSETAYITSCSHVFCEHHGSRTFSCQLICPLCKTTLKNSKYDIMKANLNPTEDLRSMILSGLRPEVIIDIAQRAIGFWNYQIHMENLYHIKKYQQSLNVLSDMRENFATQEVKMQNMQQKLLGLEKQIHSQCDEIEQLKEKLSDKGRKHSALLQKYAALERNHLTQKDNMELSGQLDNNVHSFKDTKNLFHSDQVGHFFTPLNNGFHLKKKQLIISPQVTRKLQFIQKTALTPKPFEFSAFPRKKSKTIVPKENTIH